MIPVIRSWRRALPPAEPPLPGVITPLPGTLLDRHCGACEVGWYGTAGSRCWFCGRRGGDL